MTDSESGSTHIPLIVEKKAEDDRFTWRLPLYVAAAAPIIFLSAYLYSSQWGAFFYLIGAVPIISLVLLVIGIVLAIRREPRRALAIVTALFVLWGVSWALWRNELPMRSEVRWLWNSKAYKAQVLVQPASTNGEFRHIEWDGWGFPGAGDTVVYLVFDPNDSLAVGSRVSGKLNGIPCEVPEIHRLEKDWYTVLFFTDTAWDHCAS